MTEPAIDPVRVARELLKDRNDDLLAPVYALAEVFAQQTLEDFPNFVQERQKIEEVIDGLHTAGADGRITRDLHDTISNLLYSSIERAAGVGVRTALRIDPVRFFRGEYGDLAALYRAVMDTDEPAKVPPAA